MSLQVSLTVTLNKSNLFIIKGTVQNENVSEHVFHQDYFDE